MKASRQPARPRAQGLAENVRYHARARTAGLTQLSVVVPVDKIPVLKALAVEWRSEARALLQTDLPTADQILQIHAVCRTLNLSLPEDAFRTRGAAANWLLAQEPGLVGAKPSARTSARSEDREKSYDADP